MNKNITQDKTYGSIFKTIFKIAIVLGLQAALMSFIQLIDNLFIGHLENATYIASALNAVNNMTFIINMVILNFIAGLGIYLTQFNAENNSEKIQEIFKYKLFWISILSIAFLILFSIFLKPIADLWISDDDQVLKEKTMKFVGEYGYIIIPTSIFQYGCLAFSSSYKEMKQVKLPVIIAIVAIVINSALNYPLIYSLKLGVKGSAIATAIARVVELLLWIVIIKIKKPKFCFNIKTSFNNFRFKRILFYSKKPFLWMLGSIATSLAFTVQIMLYSSYSISAGASLNAAGMVAQLCLAFVGGYSTAVAIIINHKISEYKNNKDIQIYIKKCLVLSIIYGMIISVIACSLAPLVPILYPKYTNETIYNSQLMLYAIASSLVLNLISGILIAILKSSGHSVSILIINIILGWVFGVLISFILTRVVDSNLSIGYIYWICQVSALVQIAIISIVYLIRKKHIKPIKKYS